MVNVRSHSDEAGQGGVGRTPTGLSGGVVGGAGAGVGGGAGGLGGRLNLLLSHAGWEPECWADRLPRLLEPMGVQSLRAHTGTEATAVIREYPIHIAVVDLGLPLDSGRTGEESGERVLHLLSRSPDPPPVVVVKRGRTHRDASRELAEALRVGAFAVIDRPRHAGDLELLLEVLRRCLHRHYHGRWPGC